MDKKAKKILTNTYWSGKGWIDAQEREISGSDFEYAKAQGVMFEPVTLTHDQCIAGLNRLVKEVPLKKVTDAFLASLSSKRLDLRSGLASYASAMRKQEHAFIPNPEATELVCKMCGGYESYENQDLNVLNFERIKWGGVRLGDPLFNLFDLMQLEQTTEPLVPVQADYEIFNNILYAISNSEPNDTATKLEQNLKDVVPSSKSERKTLIEILACSGILKPLNTERVSKGKSDWLFADQWRGEDHYSNDAVQYYFSDYEAIAH